MRKHLVKLLSAVLFINFLIFNVFYGSSIVYAKDGITSYTVSATFGQTLGRKHAEHVNEFRQSDTWEYNPDGTKRQISGLNGLTYDYGLEKIATQRAVEIAFHFAHTRPDDTDCFTAYGELYPDVTEYAFKGENIAYVYGVSDPENVILNAWKEENEDYSGQGHRRNMLDPDFQYIGVGHVIINGTHYWTQEFSSVPYSQVKTAPIDTAQAVTVSVKDSLVGNEVSIPKTKAPDTSKNVTVWDFSSYGSEVRTGSKNKVDISSGFSTESVNGIIKKQKFRSSNKKIVKVNNKGIITGGKTAGEAEITMLARVDGSKEWIEVGKIRVKNVCPVMTKKEKLSVGATVSANKWLSGTEEPVLRWESSKPDVANVIDDGTVTVLKSGRTKIYPVFIFGRSKVGTTVSGVSY